MMMTGGEEVAVLFSRFPNEKNDEAQRRFGVDVQLTLQIVAPQHWGEAIQFHYVLLTSFQVFHQN